MELTLGDWIMMFGLGSVLLGSLPTVWEALRYGNQADPLGREIEEELRRRESSQRATG